MKKIRIGNDIAIAWSINVDRTPYLVEGKPAILYVSSGNGMRMRIADFTVSGSIVSFTFRGKDQITAGIYTLSLLVNPGEDNMLSFDCCEAFQLVDWTCLAESGEDSPVELEVGTNADVSIVQPVIPTIGDNGNWFIEGSDTGKPSVGLSAYEIAVLHGFQGTEEEWVAASTPMLAGISSITADAIVIADGTPPTVAVRKTPNGQMVDLHFMFGIPGNASGGTPHLDLAKTAVEFESEGGQENIQVSSNLKWDIERNGIPEWLEVSPDQDIGDGTVSIKAKENTGTSSRTSSVTIKGHNGASTSVSCVQSGFVPYIEVTECPETAPAAGGIITISGKGNASTMYINAPGCIVTRVAIGDEESSFDTDEVTVDTNAGTGETFLFAVKIQLPANDELYDITRQIQVGQPGDYETVSVSQNGHTVKITSTPAKVTVPGDGDTALGAVVNVATMQGIDTIAFRTTGAVPSWMTSLKIRFMFSSDGASYSEDLDLTTTQGTYTIESGKSITGYCLLCACSVNKGEARSASIGLSLWAPDRPESEGAASVQTVTQEKLPATRFIVDIHVTNYSSMAASSKKCIINLVSGLTGQKICICNYTASGYLLPQLGFDAECTVDVEALVGTTNYSTIEIDCGIGKVCEYELGIGNANVSGETSAKVSGTAYSGALSPSVDIKAGSTFFVLGTINILAK